MTGTWFSICVRKGELVGMGRIIGDGGCAFQIVDIAVHPDHQRQGVGNEGMERLIDRLRKHAPRSAYVSLIADGEAANLYERFGFKATAPRSIGMSLRL